MAPRAASGRPPTSRRGPACTWRRSSSIRASSRGAWVATYVDNRGERDHVFPQRHPFAWTPATREDHVRGRHPHVNVLDEVFIDEIPIDLLFELLSSRLVPELGVADGAPPGITKFP